MPVKQVAMRKIKECLRLKWSCGLSHAQIAKALNLSKGVICKYAQLAEAAGLDWDRVSSLDETSLQHLLIPNIKRTRGTRALPDWTIAHREMHKKGITLQLLWEEYVEVHRGVANISETDDGISDATTIALAIRCGAEYNAATEAIAAARLNNDNQRRMFHDRRSTRERRIEAFLATVMQHRSKKGRE